MGQQEPGKGWSGWAAVHGVGLVSTPTQLPPVMPRMGLRPNTPHLPSAPILAKQKTQPQTLKTKTKTAS